MSNGKCQCSSSYTFDTIKQQCLSSNTNESGLSAGAIIGIIVGSIVVAAAVIGILIYVFVFRKSTMATMPVQTQAFKSTNYLTKGDSPFMGRKQIPISQISPSDNITSNNLIGT